MTIFIVQPSCMNMQLKHLSKRKYYIITTNINYVVLTFGRANIFCMCNFNEKLMGNAHKHNRKRTGTLNHTPVTEATRTLTSDM